MIRLPGAGFWRPSGGLTYHLRAWRSQKAWRPFRDAIASWLAEWKIEKDELILIGPSGGYTLPREWLQGFRKIHAYDADPLAGLFFRRQHPQANAEFHREDVFWQKDRLSSAKLDEIVSRHPRAALLFSNVLGQVLLEGRADEGEWRRFLKKLGALLATREWASYHDLYSVAGLPRSKHEETLNRFRESKSVNAFERGTVTDHLLTDVEWPKASAKTIFGWSLTDRDLHLVEAVRGGPP